MRIALRTGGGRGVYELAGRQGERVASDLFGLEIFYELTPEIIIPGRSVADRRQGKPRIALDAATAGQTTHVYRLLSSVLLLPKPKREFKTTHGSELLEFESYSMTAIKVDVAGITPTTVLLRPTDLLLENADGLQMRVSFTSRMARIVRLWEAAKLQDSQFAELVRNLLKLIRADDPDYKIIERAAQAISRALETKGDALPKAEQMLGLIPIDNDSAQLTAESSTVDTTAFGVDDELTPQEALVQRIKVWRKQADRGASARKFSQLVSNAYDSRCLFSGQRLPRLEITNSSGVDSAHILPWSSHDLNSVRNGICLSKQFHWAFDEGILRLDFDSTSNLYVISLPDRIRISAESANFDLKYFREVIGPIARSRLPKDPALWPSPTYISELNRYMTAS